MLRKIIFHSSRFSNNKFVVKENLYLGRCSPLSINDNRCSRKQIKVIYSSGNIEIMKLGINPSFIKRGNEQIELQYNKVHDIQDGDRIFVFLNQYPVDITFKTIKRKYISDIKYEEPPIKINKRNFSTEIQRKEEENNENNNFTLAFPSLSTSTFMFNLDKASDIACKNIKEFLTLHKEKDIRVHLVDISESETISMFRNKLKKESIDDNRFSIVIGDITTLNSKNNITANCIVNTANSTLSDKGHGVNSAIHKAIGKELITKSKQLHPSRAKVGVVYPVTLSANSLFHQQQGVQHILQVCGPNMNPKRANYLHDDYELGCQLLDTSYQNIFSTFYNKYKERMNKTKDSPKPSTLGNIPRPKGGWKNSLYSYIDNTKLPEVYYHDNEVCIVQDKYPKAERHYLVLPKQTLLNFSHLRVSHVPLLKNMKKHAERIINEFNQKDNINRQYMIGFHSIPSMNQVHLHVVSKDLNSASLKHKKHWNSFTTEFFIPVDDFINKLEENGSISFDKVTYEELLKKPLKCHFCSQTFSTMPKLKTHLQSCSN